VTRAPSLQFRIPTAADPAAVVATLRDRVALTLQEGRVRNLSLTLLDSFDWRVFEAGGFLELEAAGRQRRLTWWSADETQTLASTAVHGTPRFCAELPAGRLREALEPVLDGRALLPQVRLRSRIRTLEGLDGSDKMVVRLTLEEHRAERQGHPPGPWMKRLRLHPVRGYPEPVETIAEIARGPLGLDPEEQPLYLQALAAVGRAPGDYNPKLDFELPATLRTDAALQVVLRKLFDTVLANEDGIRRQVDTEFLHDLRVAVRRARSLLGQVKGVFPERAVLALRNDLGWVGTGTNLARDMDVYLLAFDGYHARLPEDLRPHLEPFRAFLQDHRARAYHGLVELLDSARFRRLTHRWRSLVRRAPPRRPTSPRARQPIGTVARKRIWRAYRRVMRQGRAIRPGSRPARLHELRIACKKLRYLMEFFRSLYPPETIGELIKALKAFQDNLGEFQDLQVQREQLGGFERAMAREGTLPAATAEAMERLVEGLSERQAEVRREFDERFSAFAGRETRHAFRQLFRPERVGGTP
jgi:CHAD domain-containing protein